MTATFTKRYTDAGRCEAAWRHYDWLARHAPVLRLPRLIEVGPVALTFERIDGHHAWPASLVDLASRLGFAHGAAYTSVLHRVDLAGPPPWKGPVLSRPYLSSRAEILNKRFQQEHISGQAELDRLADALGRTAALPAAFYKDANCRNFLIDRFGMHFAVDFDSLDLAPVGYDLAKLIVSVHMTHRSLTIGAIEAAVNAYSTALTARAPGLAPIGRSHIADLIALQVVFTAPYLGRHGYRYPADALAADLMEST